MQQLVPVDLPDQAARVVMVCDIRRVLGEDVAHDLADRLIALAFERVIDLGEDLFHLLVFLFF